MTDPVLAAAIVGQPYTQTFTSIRGTLPVSYALSVASAAPPGLTLTTAGVLSGTPTAAGGYAFTVVATDAALLFDEQPCTLQAYQSVTAPAGMISWWKAEGNALDSVGVNNGALQGGAGYAAGEVGQAFSLDGSSGCVEIPDAPGLRPASLTVEAWVLFDSTSGLRTVFAKPVGTGPNDSYTLWLNDGTLNGIACDVTDLGAQLAARTPLTTGTWYHVAYTVDDGAQQQALYVNGVQVAIGATTRSAGDDTQSAAARPRYGKRYAELLPARLHRRSRHLQQGSDPGGDRVHLQRRTRRKSRSDSALLRHRCGVGPLWSRWSP